MIRYRDKKKKYLAVGLIGGNQGIGWLRFWDEGYQGGTGE